MHVNGMAFRGTTAVYVWGGGVEGGPIPPPIPPDTKPQSACHNQRLTATLVQECYIVARLKRFSGDTIAAIRKPL